MSSVVCRKWLWGGGLWTLVCLLCGVWLAPWRWAGTTPVELVLHAPVDSAITVHWGEDDASLPLVPVGHQENGWAWYWTTELPPRPEYALSFEFAPQSVEMTFAEVRVWGLTPFKHQVGGARAADALSWKAEGLVPGTPSTDRVPLRTLNGGQLIVSEPVSMGASLFGSAMLGPLATLWIFGLLGWGLFGAGWWFPWRFPATRRPRQWAIAGIVFLVAAAIHWHLSTRALPGFWVADSTSYVAKGLSLAYDGNFDTGQYEYELNRTPGFPLIIAAAFRLLGPEIESIVMLQTLLALVAWAVFFSQIRWFLPYGCLLVVIPLVLLSPPLVWSSRVIATESSFASLWALATASFLAAWRLHGRRFWGAWGLFAIFVVWGTLIRMNGLLVLVLPGCALVGLLVRQFFGKRELRGSWMGSIGILAIPFGLLLLALVAWSVRNAASRGYARPSDLAPVVAANAPFNAGMLDVRVFENPEEYAWVVRSRYDWGYFFPGWSLRNRRYMDLFYAGVGTDQSTIGALADSLHAFTSENAARIPLEGKLIAWWRVLGWGLWMPDRGPFTQDGMLSDYTGILDFPEDQAWRRKETAARFEWLHREREDGERYPLLKLEPREGSSILTAHNHLAGPYHVVYRVLSGIGIVALAWAVIRRRYVAVAFLAPFYVNVLLNVYFLYILARYVQVLDGFLVIGIIAAFCTKETRDTEVDARA